MTSAMKLFDWLGVILDEIKESLSLARMAQCLDAGMQQSLARQILGSVNFLHCQFCNAKFLAVFVKKSAIISTRATFEMREELWTALESLAMTSSKVSLCSFPFNLLLSKSD